MSNKPALLGGTPVRQVPYKVYATTGEEEKAAVSRVLDSGLLSGFVGRGNDKFYGGPKVREIEGVFADHYGSKYAVSFNSATSALHGTMIAAGIGPGDEVIVPPYSMSATASAVLMCHGVPIFADIEPDMFCLDVEKTEAAITPRTKAILAVNLWGQPADLDPLRALADRHGLVFVEDNAQGPGSTYRGRFSGTVGHMGVFSLNYHKSIQCGEGGVVLTDDDDLADRLRLCRNHGEVVLPDWNRDEPSWLVGYNYRLSELHAAVAVCQMKRLDGFNVQRTAIAGALDQALEGFDFLTAPKVRDGCTHVYYLYGMLYDRDKLDLSRATFLKAMAAEGVHVAVYDNPIYLLPIYLKHRRPSDPGFSRVFPGYDGSPDYRPGLCPVVENVQYERIVLTNLVRQTNTLAEVDEFARALEKTAENAAALREWERAGEGSAS